MASAPLLQFDELVAPLPGDNPAGDSVPFAIRQKLEEHRKEINPKDFPPDDPMRPEVPKWADWPAIINLTQQTLAETSKDLLVAARLTEALVKAHGFAGLRDGLHLLRLLVDDCWERINPSIEDGDLEVRAAPFNWLDDPDRGARFPTTIRTAPLVFLDGEGYGWLQWRQAQDGRGNVTPELFDKAIQATPRADCQTAVEDVGEARAELDALIQVLGTRMDAAAPALLAVHQAVSECELLAEQILKRKGPAGSAEEEAPTEEQPADQGNGSATEDRPAAGGRRMRSRADVYRQLTEAAALLQQIEPHSPIPYLIQRAVELGAMPFPQLMRALIRDENILTELNRELGIKEPSGE